MGNAITLTRREKASISNRLKKLRKMLGLRQVDLAEMLGVSAPTVVNAECLNLDAVSPNTLHKIRQFELKVAGDKGAALLRTVPK